jgi:formylglycine-generating enzyme required for sulfatase activity
MNVSKFYKIANTQYKSPLRWTGIFLFIIYLIIPNYNTVLAGTGINAQIPYSGTIVKNDGTVLADGGYRVKFIIYNVSSGGTAIYEEIRDGSTTYSGIVSPLLSIVDGRFEILLGSQNTTLSSINDDSLWVELQLDADGNGFYEEVFSPRKRIGSAMSAINSMRLVAPSGGSSTNVLSLDVTGNLVFTGDSATERMRISGAGAITASALGGVANTTTPSGFDRVLLANSSGQFSQLSLGNFWSLLGNNTITAWNGITGSFLGTTSTQPLVLATTNATAQDIRFFTGANGANERMRILGDGNIGIGTTTPQARLDVNGGIRVGNDTATCTSSNVGTLRYNNGGLQVCTASSWSYLQCPTGYIRVPGSSLYGTRDFCVMKYEAKTGSATVAASTQATGLPQVSISQTDAITACSNAGASLISNREWMTIARNIEAQGVNWTGGTVGSGGLWRGHSDNNPGNALEASIDDNLGYTGTGNVSPSIERRTHTLSNGEVIWDLSGNVWEWNIDTIRGQDKPNTNSGGFWQELTEINNFGILSYDLIRPSNTAWNSSQNMGQYYAGPVTNTTIFSFLRGSDWDNNNTSGIFSIRLSYGSNASDVFIGFRCVLR